MSMVCVAGTWSMKAGKVVLATFFKFFYLGVLFHSYLSLVSLLSGIRLITLLAARGNRVV
jgi:hypothetical protein